MANRIALLLLPVLFLSATSLTPHAASDNTELAISILDKMEKAIRNNTTLRGKMRKKERMGSKYVFAEYSFKSKYSGDALQKLYLYNIAPKQHAGVEILYVKGMYENKAIVKPNGFPYVNVPLDPNGDKLRKKGAGHHSILDLGFKYMGVVMKHMRTQLKGSEAEHIKFLEKATVDGKEVYRILIDFPNFAYVNYTVQPGEDVLDIAKKLAIGEDMILQKNAAVDGYDDVKAGQVITVPNAYAKRVILSVDKATMLPLEQAIYDDQGQYEYYKYFDIEANVSIPDEEFTPEFEEYGFKN